MLYKILINFICYAQTLFKNGAADTFYMVKILKHNLVLEIKRFID